MPPKGIGWQGSASKNRVPCPAVADSLRKTASCVLPRLRYKPPGSPLTGRDLACPPQVGPNQYKKQPGTICTILDRPDSAGMAFEQGLWLVRGRLPQASTSEFQSYGVPGLSRTAFDDAGQGTGLAQVLGSSKTLRRIWGLIQKTG